MNWERIKNRCVRQAATELRSAHTLMGERMLSLMSCRLEGMKLTSWKFSKELENKVVSVIENWDIRKWNELKTVFPDCFPKQVTGIDLTDKGWELV
jgi:hypothetical protein